MIDTEDSSQFQNAHVNFGANSDAGPMVKAADSQHPHGTRSSDAEVERRSKNVAVEDARKVSKNQNKASPIAASTNVTKSPPAVAAAAAAASTPSASSSSSPASSSGGGSSNYNEFYTEPDLEMSRASWWQHLVTVYHPNAEIGSKLVMGDIAHL